VNLKSRHKFKIRKIVTYHLNSYQTVMETTIFTTPSTLYNILMPHSMVKVASFCQIEFFKTLVMGAFLHILLQFCAKWTLIVGSFTKYNIFGPFSVNFHYFSKSGKKFINFFQNTSTSRSRHSYL
jgi:hypothetical protein